MRIVGPDVLVECRHVGAVAEHEQVKHAEIRHANGVDNWMADKGQDDSSQLRAATKGDIFPLFEDNATVNCIFMHIHISDSKKRGGCGETLLSYGRIRLLQTRGKPLSLLR